MSGDRPRWMLPLAFLAGAFGVATIVSGVRVLFGPEAARAAAGRYVPFVVWFNFFAGFAYVLGATGISRGRRWALPLALGIFAATALAFAAFGVHVALGGAFERRTVAAMALRTLFWGGVALALGRHAGHRVTAGSRS